MNFSDPLIPIPEIATFYSLEGLPVPVNRPFTWSNSVTTLDGILSFSSGARTVEDIALKNTKEAGHHSLADWRLLNAGWTHADAVMISGQNVRDEDNAMGAISFQDLVDFRITVLKRVNRQPLQIIASRHCEFSFKEPIFQRSDLSVLLLTTQKGKRFSQERISKLGEDGQKVQCQIDFLVAGRSAHRSSVNEDLAITMEEEEEIDFLQAFQRLRQDYKINYLDISCGGKTIAHLLHLGLLDEIRMTLAGQIAGPFSAFTGQPRPRLFPMGSPSYESHNSPLVSWKEIRTIGSHLIFLRGSYQYRHFSLQKTKG